MFKRVKEFTGSVVFFSLQYAIYMTMAIIMVAKGDENVVEKIIDLSDENLD